MKSAWALIVLIFLSGPSFAQEDGAAASSAPDSRPVAKPKAEKPDALKAWQENRYDDAIAICLNEIKETPYNRDSYLVLGWSLRDAGRYAEAFDYAKLGIERTGANSKLLDIAEASIVKLYAWLYDQGRLDEAAGRIMQFISYLPNSASVPSAYALLGTIQLKKGNYIFADTALSYALHANAAVFEWWASAGMARENCGDYKSALAAYTEALKLNPTDPEALRGRDRVRLKLASPPPSPSP
ncbi:MAG: tetratricopeptide repeat protein [Spirochaetales bacterium]|nr:tetratricopeptide repeat protein [Spirochaetales bacterium]